MCFIYDHFCVSSISVGCFKVTEEELSQKKDLIFEFILFWDRLLATNISPLRGSHILD